MCWGQLWPCRVALRRIKDGIGEAQIDALVTAGFACALSVFELLNAEGGLVWALVYTVQSSHDVGILAAQRSDATRSGQGRPASCGACPTRKEALCGVVEGESCVRDGCE